MSLELTVVALSRMPSRLLTRLMHVVELKRVRVNGHFLCLRAVYTWLVDFYTEDDCFSSRAEFFSHFLSFTLSFPAKQKHTRIIEAVIRVCPMQ